MRRGLVLGLAAGTLAFVACRSSPPLPAPLAVTAADPGAGVRPPPLTGGRPGRRLAARLIQDGADVRLRVGRRRRFPC